MVEVLPPAPSFGDARQASTQRRLQGSVSSRTSVVAEEGDEECTFAPQIKNVPGVESTMGDFMQGWAEKCREKRLQAAMERRRSDLEELEASQPQHLSRVANEMYLREAGYAGPVQAWRLHAEKYLKTRQLLHPSPAGTVPPSRDDTLNLTAPSGEREANWEAVVRRLYPYSGTPDKPAIEVDEANDVKQGIADRLLPLATSIRSARQGAGQTLGGSSSSSSRGSFTMPRSNMRTSSSSAATSRRSITSYAETAAARRNASSGRVSSTLSTSAGEADELTRMGQTFQPGISDHGGSIEFLEIVDAGTCPDSGRRPASTTSSADYAGVAPKQPWQRLYEEGTRRVRAKSQPPAAFGVTTPAPLPYSEKLLRNAQTPRPPVWRERSDVLPHGQAPLSSSAAVNSSGLSLHSLDGRMPGQRLYEQSEKMRAMQQQRTSVANALKTAEELRECTFCPKTHSARRSVSQDSTAESLYDRGLKAKQRRQDLAEEGARRQLAEDMKECTFHPNVRREKSSDRATSSKMGPRSARRVGNGGEVAQPSAGQDAKQRDLATSVLGLLQEWKAKRSCYSKDGMRPPGTVEDRPTCLAQPPAPAFQAVEAPEADLKEKLAASFPVATELEHRPQIAPRFPVGSSAPHLANHVEVGTLLDGWRQSWGVDGRRVLPKAPPVTVSYAPPQSPSRADGLPGTPVVSRSVEVPASPPDASDRSGKTGASIGTPAGGARVTATRSMFEANKSGDVEVSLAAMLQEWQSAGAAASDAVVAGPA
mmetsp:Transcript_19071/g.34526  ORF Transcript_19071/g.34526 Transcript_19071/m.34526 type:complete len:764 (+) Transcript_19071:62-2353(+)